MHCLLGSIQKEVAMHPVKFLFDEINREVWGMPKKETRRDRGYGTAKLFKRIGATRFSRH